MPRSTLAAYAKRKGITLAEAEARWKRLLERLKRNKDILEPGAAATAAFQR